jgi:hypothetical protein
MYLRGYLGHARPLAEALRAIAVAAEERAEAGQQAQRLWPAVMDIVLEAAQVDSRIFSERTWGDYAEAALIPNTAAGWGYLTIDLAGEPYRWRNLLSWAPQVDRWLAAVPRSRMSLDHLVIAVRELEIFRPGRAGAALDRTCRSGRRRDLRLHPQPAGMATRKATRPRHVRPDRPMAARRRPARCSRRHTRR